MVKLGKASLAAKEAASETGTLASQTLLSDYSLTNTNTALRTPRTPAPMTDKILQEAQNIMALNNVETPLKGGLNTPLVESDFSGIAPTPQGTATANTVLATPFRTPSGQQGGMTPASTRTVALTTPGRKGGAAIPGATPIRDKLSINPEEELEIEGAGTKQFQKAVKESLRDQLGTLPTPKNDYEIVVPEDEEMDAEDGMSKRNRIADKEDLDRKAMEEEQARRMEEFKKLCKAVQRNLPRPMDINETILRPPGMELTDLQKVSLKKPNTLISRELCK